MLNVNAQKPESVTFNIQSVDRIAAKNTVRATFTFTPSAGGAGPSSVTLNYPAGFFATSATPTATSSTSGAILTPAQPGATSIVLAASGTSLAAGIAVTITLSGCTIGVARAATDSITVQTNTDPTASSPAVSSGVIGGAVTTVSFNIAPGDRVAGKTGVQATFAFTPSAGLGFVSNSWFEGVLPPPVR